MCRVRMLAIVGMFVASSVGAGGFAHNANFLVFTPAEPSHEAGETLAREVLQQADMYRAQIAMDWFGEELPPSIGRTVINVSFSELEDRALTWAKDHPDRKFHNIYLKTTPERVLGGNLRHEIAHVMLATRFAYPNRLPAWVEEGIASQYDDPERLATRKDILGWYVRTSDLPEISRILHAQSISADDEAAYAVASSLTDYLLRLQGKTALLQFARASKKESVEAALKRYYAIEDIPDLQSKWESQLQQTAQLAWYRPSNLQ